MGKYEPKHVAAFRGLKNRCCVWRIFVGFLVNIMQLDDSPKGNYNTVPIYLTSGQLSAEYVPLYKGN
jgi:hypothetical protein